MSTYNPKADIETKVFVAHYYRLKKKKRQYIDVEAKMGFIARQ